MSQARVEIYTSAFCGFCARAKALLRNKDVEFEEIDVGFGGADRRIMTERAGGRTSVPQIFIDGHHVGGCDDLQAAEASGELDKLLSKGA
jgi:glutaredoxin 3